MNMIKPMGKQAIQLVFSSDRQFTMRDRLQMWLTLSFAFGAIVLMSMSTASLQPGVTDLDTMEQGIQYAFAGTLALGAGLLIYHTRVVPLSFASTKLVGSVNWIAGIVGMLCIGALAESSIHEWGISQLDNVSHYVQFRLLVVGCILLIWGFGGVGWPWQWVRAARSLSKSDWYEIGFVLAITIVALAVRFWKLETAIHQFVDELNFAVVSSFFWGDNPLNILDPVVRGFPAIYPFMQNEMTSIFGRNLLGLRAISAILGALGVPATYLFARALFDRPTAIIAGLLMISFPPHVHFSRFGLNNIADASFGILALAFLARGWRYNRRVDFVIGGVALGLTQYFYEGGRLVFPPLVVIWSAYGLLIGYSRKRFLGLIWAALMATVVAAPIYLTLEDMGAQLTPRANLTGEQTNLLGLYENTQLDTYPPNLRLSFQVYFSQPEFSTIWYGGDTGMILLFLAPLFLLGIGYTLVTGLGPNIVLPIWVILTSFGISLINDTGAYVRYVAVFPALVVFIAVGLRVLLTLLVPRTVSKDGRVVVHILVAIAIFVSAVQLQYYFGPHLTQMNRQIRTHLAYDGQDAVFRVVDYPVGTKAYIISYGVEPERYLNGVLGYMIDNPDNAIRVYTPEEMNRNILNSISLRNRTFLFVPPTIDKKSLLVFHRFFILRGPERSPFDSVPEDKQLLMYEIIDYRR